MDATQKIQNRIAPLDDQMLHLCLDQIGGGQVDAERQIVRAYLISEIEKRHGEDAADAAMDRIGL